MKKTFFEIKNQANLTNIHVTGEIGYDVDYAAFRNALINTVSSGVKRVKLVLNSCGGDMTEGFAMYDYIMSTGLTVEVEIIGMAASMAGVFSQCAGKGLLGMHENALFMTHKPQSISVGESSRHRTTADTSDKLEEKAKKVFTNRGIAADAMADWFKDGQMKWFTAEEALEAGICDYIIKSNRSSAKPEKPASSFKNMGEAFKYYNSFLQNQKPKSKSNMNKLLMSVVLMLNNAGVTNVNLDSSEDEVVTALNTFNVANSAKISQLQAVANNAAKSIAVSMIAGYKASGHLPADLSEVDTAKWVDRAEKSPDAVKDLLDAVKPTVAALPDFNNLLDKTRKKDEAGLPSNKDSWTLPQWEQNDPKGLKNMLENNLDAYKKLFKAEYGVDF
jgi:ATP-dependent Clp protease protease subunit